MLPKQGRKTPASSNQTNIDAVDRDDSGLALSIPCFYLMFNTLGTIYRAYTNNDIALVVFVVFVLAGYFYLDYCLTEFRRLPADEESTRKQYLKITIWGLSSAIMFGFAYLFSTFMSWAFVVILYSVTFVGSAFVFYVYFIFDEGDSTRSNCSTTTAHEKIKFKGIKFSVCPPGGGKPSDQVLRTSDNV